MVVVVIQQTGDLGELNCAHGFLANKIICAAVLKTHANDKQANWAVFISFYFILYTRHTHRLCQSAYLGSTATPSLLVTLYFPRSEFYLKIWKCKSPPSPHAGHCTAQEWLNLNLTRLTVWELYSCNLLWEMAICLVVWRTLQACLF